MRFIKFNISNFRGIKKIELDLSRTLNSQINVLVGLNESGKTTLLEALNHFSYAVDLRKPDPTAGTRSSAIYQSLIPISERSNFKGVISIQATISITRADWARIATYLRVTHDFICAEMVSSFTVNKKFSYKDSQYIGQNNEWSLVFRGRKKGGRKDLVLSGEAWLDCIHFVAALLPQVVYFPAEIFDFPSQIFLEETKSGPVVLSKNEFYYNVFSDALRAIDESLTIETHIFQRLNSPGHSERQNLEALLVKVEQHLTRTVLTVWENIFGQKLEGKQFRVSVQKDNSKRAFLQIKLVDGYEMFDIDERSAGFRWFFVFILITRYRIHRGDPVMFLFDEPAASLHPNAQAQLLKSFQDLTAHCQIIYSTHSHYLVNPKWLESTFVVKNSAAGRADDPFLMNSSSTHITVSPYRTFVGSHPEQYFYYKPILDLLDFAPAPTEFPDNAVLVEGKSDYFLITLMIRMSGIADQTRFFPGGGAGSLDALISLLAGWGKNFVVLLDSDEEGLKQKRRYESKFESLLDKRLFTLEDINSRFSGVAVEALLSPLDIEEIRLLMSPTSVDMTKKQTHRAVQEILVTDENFTLTEFADSNIREIVHFLGAKLALQNS